VGYESGNKSQAEKRSLRKGHSADVLKTHGMVLATGYAWRLPNETDIFQTVASFIRYERLCCPFFHFSLEVEPDQGPIWFSITGAVDMKAFLQSEGIVPPDDVPTSREV
jgi:hypothetical protein